MYFTAVFSLSDRSEIGSCQINPVENKEAQREGSLAKITQEDPQRDPPPAEKKGVHVGLTSPKGLSLNFIIFSNEVLHTVIVLFFGSG